MIRFGAILSVVIVAIGLLVAGAVTGSIRLVDVSIGLAVLALLTFVISVVVWRDEAFATSGARSTGGSAADWQKAAEQDVVLQPASGGSVTASPQTASTEQDVPAGAGDGQDRPARRSPDPSARRETLRPAPPGRSAPVATQLSGPPEPASAASPGARPETGVRPAARTAETAAAGPASPAEPAVPAQPVPEQPVPEKPVTATPQTGSDKPGIAKPGDSKPGIPGTAKPGDSKPGDSKPGDSKPGDSKPGDSKPVTGQAGVVATVGPQAAKQPASPPAVAPAESPGAGPAKPPAGPAKRQVAVPAEAAVAVPAKPPVAVPAEAAVAVPAKPPVAVPAEAAAAVPVRAPGSSPADSSAGQPGSQQPAAAAAAASRPDAGPGGSAEVTVVPGIERYHRAECILIRFLGPDDLNIMMRSAAEEAGCAPCKACRPDRA